MWLVFWSAGVALAQDRVVWDFDTRMPGWWVDGGDALVTSPFGTGQALELTLHAETGGDVFGGVGLFPVAPDAWIYTHEQVVFDYLEIDDGAGPIQVYPQFEGTDANGQITTVDRATTSTGPVVTDVAALCGLAGTATLTCFGPGAMTIPPGTATFDNFVATGPVCDRFVDGDADGRCPQGVDADADGVCISAGEALPPGQTSDCDDTVVGPACLTLAVVTMTVGGNLEAEVAGAQPGETVHLLGSRDPGSACPPILGGVCLELANPKVVGSAVADAAGTALVSRPVPASYAPGDARWLQAVVVRPGLDSDRSPAVLATAQ